MSDHFETLSIKGLKDHPLFPLTKLSKLQHRQNEKIILRNWTGQENLKTS